mgnify:CR=1 FL=1
MSNPTLTPFTWNREQGLTTTQPLPQHVAVAATAALDEADDGGNEVLDEYDRKWRIYGDEVEYGRTSVAAEGHIAYDAQRAYFVVKCEYIRFEYWGVDAPGYCVREVCYEQQGEPDDPNAADDEYSEGWSRLITSQMCSLRSGGLTDAK